MELTVHKLLHSDRKATISTFSPAIFAGKIELNIEVFVVGVVDTNFKISEWGEVGEGNKSSLPQYRIFTQAVAFVS